MALLRAVPTLAGRRTSSAFRPIARHLPIISRSASTYPPRPSLWKYTLGFVSGAGAGVGTCFVWWKYAPNLTPFAPSFQPDLDLEAFDQLLQQQPVREVLDKIGSSSKLNPVFDNNELTISLRAFTLLKKAPNTPAIRAALFRIEDTEIEPGKPNIVGLLAIVEPHPDPNMPQLMETFVAIAMARDDQGELARPGLALIVVECSGVIASATYERPVIEEDGGHAGYSDNSVIEDINE